MTASMSWELDREHEEFRASVRAFVDRQVRPVVEESEEAGRPPAALLKEMGSAGLPGLAVPEEYGGGGDTLAIVLLSGELARASGGIAVTALVTGYMSTPHIAHFGTGEQRARYLPGLVSGKKLASIAVIALPKTRTGKIMRRLLRDVVEQGGPQGDTSAMEDLAGLQAVQQAVAAEAAPTA